MNPRIAWCPRIIMSDRVFRLAVEADEIPLTVVGPEL